MGGNGNRGDGKCEWGCSVGMGMGGNWNDSMGVGRELEQESLSRTPLIHGTITLPLLAIVRFRWLEAASGTVCRPTSPQLQR